MSGDVMFDIGKNALVRPTPIMHYDIIISVYCHDCIIMFFGVIISSLYDECCELFL